MKKYKVILLFLCISIVMTACNMVAKPQSSVDTLFKAMQTLDSVKMQSVLFYEQGKEPKDKDPFADNNFKEIFSKNSKIIKYKINDISINGDTAVVKVNCTYGDALEVFGTAFQTYFQKALASAFTNQSTMNDKDSEKLLFEELNKSLKEKGLKSVTTDLDIQLKKIDNKWLVVSDDNIANIMTANVYKAFSDLSKSFADTSKK